jgi:hypothetical protein
MGYTYLPTGSLTFFFHILVCWLRRWITTCGVLGPPFFLFPGTEKSAPEYLWFTGAADRVRNTSKRGVYCTCSRCSRVELSRPRPPWRGLGLWLLGLLFAGGGGGPVLVTVNPSHGQSESRSVRVTVSSRHGQSESGTASARGTSRVRSESASARASPSEIGTVGDGTPSAPVVAAGPSPQEDRAVTTVRVIGRAAANGPSPFLCLPAWVS